MVDPLVSCVMPTCNRRAFIPAAIDCWQKQTYQNRELIILDDGEDPIREITPDAKGIYYYRAGGRIGTLGKKRNVINGYALGAIICHWDDDDWSADDRIADQVARLCESGKPVTGYSSLLFWEAETKQAKRYQAQVSGYVCGTTLMYLKSFWEMHPFKDKQKASDNDFVWPILRQVATWNGCSHMVARIHGDHTSDKSNIRDRIPVELIPQAFWENEKLRLS
jgi:O-antigen biosynthesis protein